MEDVRIICRIDEAGRIGIPDGKLVRMGVTKGDLVTLHLSENGTLIVEPFVE